MLLAMDDAAEWNSPSVDTCCATPPPPPPPPPAPAPAAPAVAAGCFGCNQQTSREARDKVFGRTKGVGDPHRAAGKKRGYTPQRLPTLLLTSVLKIAGFVGVCDLSVPPSRQALPYVLVHGDLRARARGFIK